MPLIDVPPKRQTFRREQLQVLVERIKGIDCAGLQLAQDTVAVSWNKISVYVLADCFETQAPEPPARPDWRTIAKVEAYFANFVYKLRVLPADHWAAAFPLDEFCTTWVGARQEFHDELSRKTGRVSQRNFQVFLGLLSTVDSPLPSMISAHSLSSVTLTGYVYMDQHGVYQCYHSGCSDILTDDLQHLKFNKDTFADSTAMQSLQEEAQSFMASLDEAEKRTMQLLE